MSRDVLVVGSEGFIGKRLMRLHPYWKRFDLKLGQDFCEYDWLKCDAIVLLAAWMGNTEEDYLKNLQIYEALTRTVIRNKKQPFVLYVSSAAVYAGSMMEHYESEMLLPPTLYGKSKALGEDIVEDLCDQHTILRLSNVYGEGDGHGVIDILKRGGKTIYGDGEQVRDFVHVNTVVKAISRVMTSPDRYEGKTYNISSGKGLSINEVFDRYGTGSAVYKEAREYDVPHSVLNNDWAKLGGLL